MNRGARVEYVIADNGDEDLGDESMIAECGTLWHKHTIADHQMKII